MNHYDTIIIDDDDDINIEGPNEDGEPELTFRCPQGGRVSLVMSEGRLRRCAAAIAAYLRRVAAGKAGIEGFVSAIGRERCRAIEHGDDPDTAA